MIAWNVYWKSVEVGKFVGAAGVYAFDFWSECKENKKTHVTVEVLAVGVGIGTPVTLQGGMDHYEDGLTEIFPYQFSGEFTSFGLSAGLGVGGGFSAVRVGNYKSQGWCIWGVSGAGFSKTTGTAVVNSIEVIHCDCKDKN